MATSPTPISALPTVPSRSMPAATFTTTADAFLAALPTFRTQTNDAATVTYNNAVVSETKANEAATSATNAATSASNAATSATNASNSASAAATSETNAATSASNAAASYDAFDDRFLGAKVADPALDNDGAALLTGALYFNTTVNEMRVYSGTAWLATYLPAGGYVVKSGDTMTGALNVPAGATGTQAPQVQEVVKKAGDTLTGALNFAGQELVTAVIKDSALKYVDLGNSGTTAQVLNHDNAHHYKLTATGNHSISFSGWPTAGTGVIVLDLVNGGAFTITLPTATYQQPDGTFTSSFATYIAALKISGRTGLLASGTDRLVFTCTNNGTPIGKLVV